MELKFCDKHLKLITKRMIVCPECLREVGGDIVELNDKYYINIEHYFVIINLLRKADKTFSTLERYSEYLKKMSNNDFPEFNKETQLAIIKICKELAEDLENLINKSTEN